MRAVTALFLATKGPGDPAISDLRLSLLRPSVAPSNTKTGPPDYTPLPLAQASTHPSPPTLQIKLPFLEVLLQPQAQIEAFTAQTGLKIRHAPLEAERDPRCGTHGQQTAYRHDTQPGYVVFAGRTVSSQQPRLRQNSGPELTLQNYAALQQDGRLQRAVARQLTHQVSTRNDARALDTRLAGYGLDQSSVWRQWTEATAGQPHKLCQRPVPADRVALFLDGQPFRRECLIGILGVDRAGKKHVWGLWHETTENATRVRELLTGLRERGLNPEAALLGGIDGARALYKGVQDLFGERASIQRRRVHKLRNGVEPLPKEKRAQAVWRWWSAPLKLSHELSELLAALRAASNSDNQMKRTRHSPEQIVTQFHQAATELAGGKQIEEVCKALVISPATYHRWQAQYGDADLNTVKELKALKEENAKLKKRVADLSVDWQANDAKLAAEKKAAS